MSLLLGPRSIISQGAAYDGWVLGMSLPPAASTKSCTAAVSAVSAGLQVFGNKEAGITRGLGHPLCAEWVEDWKPGGEGCLSFPALGLRGNVGVDSPGVSVAPRKAHRLPDATEQP